MCRLNASTYAAHLVRSCARLAAGQVDGMPSEVAAGSAGDIERYLQVGWGERRMLLTQELALVGLAFNNFSSLVDRYLCTVSKVAQVPQCTDHQRFLRWLQRTRQLTPQQRDFIAYQQAEYACLNRARVRRTAHLAFQQLRSSATTAMHAHPTPLWHVNPIRVWSRLALPHSDSSKCRPSDMIFFPIGERIENIHVSTKERHWLGKLPIAWSGTFAQWLNKTGCRYTQELQASLDAWAVAGLVAVERELLSETAEPHLRIPRASRR